VKFVIRSAARKDILQQYRHYLIEAEDGAVAQRFLGAVQSAIMQVCRYPEMGASKILRNPKLAGLRSWSIREFPDIRVYYLVTEKVLRVVRVLHGKRDISPILEVE